MQVWQQLTYHLNTQSVYGVFGKTISILQHEFCDIFGVARHHDESVFDSVEFVRPIADEMRHSEDGQFVGLTKGFNYTRLKYGEYTVWENVF